MYKEHTKPFLIERIVSALSYLTVGFVGFIWLIIGLLRRTRLTPFLQYHIFQSIFISIGYVLLTMLIGIILNLLSVIPLINVLAAQIAFWINSPFIFGFSILQTAIYLLLFYLAGTSLMGKFSYVPFISEIIEQNVRRY